MEKHGILQHKNGAEIMLYVADRETGSLIVEVADIEEGKRVIDIFEADDKKNDEFTENFYDVVDQDHCSVLN